MLNGNGRSMWGARVRAMSMAALIVIGRPGDVSAQDAAAAPPPANLPLVAVARSPGTSRIRPLKAGTFDAAGLVSEALRRSATVRELAVSLEASDVIVWITVKDEPGLRTGRLRLMGSAGGVRRLYVEIARASHVEDQIAWLGHELWHALEIGQAPDVVDQAALERFYRRIGDRLIPGESAFETGGAVDAGRQVSRELRLAGRSR